MLTSVEDFYETRVAFHKVQVQINDESESIIVTATASLTDSHG